MTSPGSDLSRFDPHATYDRAAIEYEQASARFWGHLSDRVIEQLRLSPGSRVLDIASGPGWSAMGAARAVGPTGHVVALDSSPQMLALAADAARKRGLENIDFQVGDMTRLEFEPESFDAVISVLGIFFVPDMAGLVRELWRRVRPGGKLAIATLGTGVFDPPFTLWKEAVRDVDPEALLEFPWQRTGEPDILARVMLDAGVETAVISGEDRTIPLETPDDWWLVVMGSGMRRTVLELGDERAEQVRLATVERLSAAGITAIEVPSLYAFATKP